MRPRIQVLVRCPDHHERLRHRFRLDVWGYEPVWTLEIKEHLLRCIVIDGHTPEFVRDIRLDHHQAGIIVIADETWEIARYIEHGADVVLTRDILKSELNLNLRCSLRRWREARRGPRNASIPFVPAMRRAA